MKLTKTVILLAIVPALFSCNTINTSKVMKPSAKIMKNISFNTIEKQVDDYYDLEPIDGIKLVPLFNSNKVLQAYELAFSQEDISLYIPLKGELQETIFKLRRETLKQIQDNGLSISDDGSLIFGFFYNKETEKSFLRFGNKVFLLSELKEVELNSESDFLDMKLSEVIDKKEVALVLEIFDKE